LNRRPLRPELAAPLGVWPSSQLGRCAGDRARWPLSGDVAVLFCCIADAPSGFEERPWLMTRHRCYLHCWRSGLAREARSSRVYPASGLPRLVGRKLRVVIGSGLRRVSRRLAHRRQEQAPLVRARAQATGRVGLAASPRRQRPGGVLLAAGARSPRRSRTLLASRASWRHAREPRPPCGAPPRRRPAPGRR